MSDKGVGILRLHPEDERAQALLLDALDEAHDQKPVSIRCHKHCHLASVGTTRHGPLLTSSWSVDTPSPVAVMDADRRMRPRQAKKWLDAHAPVARQSGGDEPEVHGVLALLALPPELPQDYPDLMVRCSHGDAVLDRFEVVRWSREGWAPKVTVTPERRAYLAPTWVGGEMSESRQVRTLGGTAVPLRELKEFLGW